MINKIALRLVLAILASVVFLSACSSSEDELALRSNISAMQDAITSRQPDMLMQHIDPNYKSPLHRDINALNNFVKDHLSYNRVIYLYLADIEIDLDNDRAKIIFNSGIAGGPDQIPERGKLFKVGTHWLKIDGQWKVTQAKWRPVLWQKQ